MVSGAWRRRAADRRAGRDLTAVGEPVVARRADSDDGADQDRGRWTAPGTRHWPLRRRRTTQARPVVGR